MEKSADCEIIRKRLKDKNFIGGIRGMEGSQLGQFTEDTREITDYKQT